MSKSHKKRRNVGLLYEFLVRTISQALIEGDTKKSADALKLLRRHFKKGTELYKEFRLVNSLLTTTVSSEAVAASILYEAKAAARAHNVAELERQKSLLISNINHVLNDDTFYDQQVNEYKTYATVQTLLNDWRSQEPDLRRVAQYEDQLVKWLASEKNVKASPAPIAEESPGTCRLMMKVMMKKLNEKYSGILTAEQKQLIRSYAFASVNNNDDIVKRKLVEVRDNLIAAIDAYKSSSDVSEFVVNKVNDVRNRLLAENVEVVDDDTVVRFMLYTKLFSELQEDE